MDKNSKINRSGNDQHLKTGYIQVTGGKVWYKTVGNNIQATPLLVLHGGPGASHDYLEPLEKFADERPLIFYDQLGCGNSDKPDNTSFWNLERFVDELQQVIHFLALEKVHILGQSWGSSLAVEYYLTKHPQEVNSLILSGPLLSASRWINDQKSYIKQLPGKTRKVILQYEKTGEFDSPEYKDAMMVFYKKHVCRLDNWPDYLSCAFSKLNLSQYEYMWGPSEFTVTGTLKNYERVELLNKIDIPVLFTCGEYDEATPDTTRYYQQNLPDSRLHIFIDASHEHHIEKTDEYLKTVRKFLNSIDNIQKKTVFNENISCNL